MGERAIDWRRKFWVYVSCHFEEIHIKVHLFPFNHGVEVSISGSLQKEKEVLHNIKGCPYVIECSKEEITNQEKGKMVYNLLLEYAFEGTPVASIEKFDRCRLSKTDVKHYTWSILKGLSHIQECGCIHYDINRKNVLLVPAISPSGNFVAKIWDLGLAKCRAPFFMKA